LKKEKAARLEAVQTSKTDSLAKKQQDFFNTGFEERT
jgi:hypothetical protein